MQMVIGVQFKAGRMGSGYQIYLSSFFGTVKIEDPFFLFFCIAEIHGNDIYLSFIIKTKTAAMTGLNRFPDFSGIGYLSVFSSHIFSPQFVSFFPYPIYLSEELQNNICFL